MSRKTIIGALAGLAVVLAAIIILIPKGRSDRRAETARDIPKSEVKSAAKAPSRLTLGLDINRDMEELLSGFPMVFSATLRNLGAEEASRLRNLIEYYSQKAPPEERGRASDSVRRWRAEIESLPSAPLTLKHGDKPVSEWISFELWEDGRFVLLPWLLKPLTFGETKKLEIGKDRIHLDYLVPENIIRDIRPGDYKIRARLSAGLSASVVDEIVSREVTFRLRPAEGADEGSLIQNHHDAGILCLRQADYLKAESHARDILFRDGKDVGAMILLGRAIEGRGDLEEAEKAYSDALNAFIERNPDEPPSAFLMKKKKEFLTLKMKKFETRRVKSIAGCALPPDTPAENIR